MRRTRFAPLALLILAAACTEDTVTTPPDSNVVDNAEKAAYLQAVDEIINSAASTQQAPKSVAGSLAPAAVQDAGPAVMGPYPVEVVNNGSFESGDFTGWSTATTNTPFGNWRVDMAGVGSGFSMALVDPQDGVYTAWNGFDGLGPMDFLLSQEVTIPAGDATLSWWERVQWNFALLGSATQPRTQNVEIRDPSTGAVLATLHTFSTGTAPVIGDSGWQYFTEDVSAFAGQTVELVFRQHVPEPFTGPAQVEIDGVSLVVEEGSPEIAVELDIMPDSDDNPVNLRSRGVLPVAILTTDAFDAADVDVSSVTLGDDEGEDTSVAARGKSPRQAAHPHASLEDVDDDGDVDLSLKFRTEDLVENGDLNDGTTELFLNGATQDGTPIVGSDGVTINAPPQNSGHQPEAQGKDQGR